MRAVDLFAGAGGMSEGARLAGLQVVWAANHWAKAVDAHKLNHPGTEHACQDLQQFDFGSLPPFDILLASPACEDHSRAKGQKQGAKRLDDTRSTAWAVISCVEACRPAKVIVENVPEFLGWQLFPVWRSALETMGYSFSSTLIDAADCSVPQNRERVMMVASLGHRVKLQQPTAAHVPASTCIEWDTGSWSDIRKPGRAQATIDRWEAGRLNHGARFLTPFYGSGSGKTGRSLNRPIGTLTKRDRWALHDGDRMRMLTVREQLALQGFDREYDFGDLARKWAVHMIGNSVPPPMAAEVISQVMAA